MEITSVSNATSSLATSGTTSADQTTGASFASVLEDTSTTVLEDASTTSTTTKTKQQANVVSGRLGVDYNSDMVPYRVVYFDENGQKLTTSPFNAASILRLTQKFDISLTDLTGLGEQLDALGIGYRPYELYSGTGSDHGIDFDDLIAGGLGTAYDWRKDANVDLKGAYAAADLASSQQLAEDLGLESHPEVTTERGIDSSYFTTLQTKGGTELSQVVFTGGTASWYATAEEAATAATNLGGQVFDLTNLAASALSTQIAALGTTDASVVSLVDPVT